MTPAARLDVRAYACPITWVKTRIALERLAEGEVLEVLLSPGEPARSVPQSAAEDGHRVLGLEPLSGQPGGSAPSFRLLLAKGAPPAWP